MYHFHLPENVLYQSCLMASSTECVHKQLLLTHPNCLYCLFASFTSCYIIYFHFFRQLIAQIIFAKFNLLSLCNILQTSASIQLLKCLNPIIIKVMGSQPSNSISKPQDAIIKPQTIDSKFFDSQVQKMKYVKNKDKNESIRNFKQRTDETQLALSFALVNLKKNHLLSTCQFLNLQGSGNREKKLPTKRQFKVKQANMLRKSSSSKGDLLFPEIRYNYNVINNNSANTDTNINTISNLSNPKNKSYNKKTEPQQQDYRYEVKQSVIKKFSVKKANELNNRNSQVNLSKNSQSYLNNNFRSHNIKVNPQNRHQKQISYINSIVKLNNYLAAKPHKFSGQKASFNPQNQILKIELPKRIKSHSGSPKYILIGSIKLIQKYQNQ